MLPRILRLPSLQQPTLRSLLLPSLAVKNALALKPPTKLSSTPIPTLTFVRHATHKMSRAANGAKSPAGRRLGAKKSSGEYVKIGMIIFRQKGTLWYPGENAGMGRDHTIFAMQPGYVRFYKDPAQPKRKFIGVALHLNQPLPRPPNAARVRRLGFNVQTLTEEEMRKFEKAERETAVNDDKMVGWVTPTGTYQPRMTGWRIGKFMDEKPARIQPRNKRGWIRWRKRHKYPQKLMVDKRLIEAQAETPKKARTAPKVINKPGPGMRR